VELVERTRELPTATWLRVLREAADLGVVQVHLSGGEPLVRDDLEAIAREAARLQLYTQLTTSGIGLSGDRAKALADAGVRCVQLSVQSSDAADADRIAGYRGHRLKELAAGAVRDAGLSLTINVVLHRLNLDAVGDLVDLAVRWGADRVELANAQYYNWALINRDHLMPTRGQLDAAHATVERLRARLGETVQMTWVDADYLSGRVKPCMGGWGRRSMTIAPDGRALPCPAADTIRTLTFDSVVDHSVAWLWRESPAFRAYRGTAWMPEPCRSCDRREVDFGGCRCQAYALTGEAGTTDPVCELSPRHDLVAGAVRQAEARNLAGAHARSDRLPLVHRRARPNAQGRR
jgi:pyrroloquinoline quinone biosynthesis protein E